MFNAFLHHIKSHKKMKKTIGELSLWINIILGAILLGGTIYQMIVIVPEFSRDIPNGMIELMKGHMETKAFWTSPILPLGFLFGILSLVFNWKTPRKKWLLLSLSLGLAAEIFTIVYFFPRLKIMGIFDHIPSTDLTLLTNSINEWIIADHIRCWFLIVPSFLLALKALSIKVSA